LKGGSQFLHQNSESELAMGRRPNMVSSNQKYRVEKDSMGPVEVPKGAYYGAQTQRAVENFPISGWRF